MPIVLDTDRLARELTSRADRFAGLIAGASPRPPVPVLAAAVL